MLRFTLARRFACSAATFARRVARLATAAEDRIEEALAAELEAAAVRAQSARPGR